MMYVVLGMHKSGTTLVSEILHKSGIPMVERYDPSQDYDQGAFFERYEFARLNQRILGFGDPAHHHPVPKSLTATVQQQAEMRSILCEAALQGPDWGVKEPRLSLTYPLWEPQLPEHRLIAIYRSLPQVWSHYARPGKQIREVWRVVRTWCDYNESISNILRRTVRPYLLLNYELLMEQDAELYRLERFVGRSLSDPRRIEKYRSRATGKRRLAIVAAVRAVTGATQPQDIAEELHEIRSAQVRRPDSDRQQISGFSPSQKAELGRGSPTE